MHAIILAGGSGTRLRPLTHARRKELVPLLNRPLLEYRFLNLKEHGVTDIVLACAAGLHELEEAFGDGAALGVRISYVYEERPLGSGRAVKEAARAAGARGTLVVCNGDILTNIDVSSMIARHRETAATLSISLAAVDDPWHFGVVAVDGDLRIGEFIEKPPQGEEPSNLINAGTWLWEPEMLNRIPDDETAIRDGFSERVLFPGIIADRLRVQGFVEDLWVDVGAPDRYFRATRLLLERMSAERGGETRFIGAGGTIATGAQVEGLVLVGDGASIEDGARVIGPTVLGAHACIERRATVEASILWQRAVIGAEAHVAHSIIAEGAAIGPRARADGAILADGARLADGVTAEAELRVMPGETAGA